MITAEQVLNALPNFTKNQLMGIKMAADVLIKSSRQPETLEEEDWLLRGVLVELHRRGLIDESFIRTFKLRGSSFPHFQTQSAVARKLLEDAAPGISLVERRALGEVAGRELARYITWKDLSVATMLEYVRHVPAAIEKAFPGYIADKSLAIIIKQRVS